jgi:hypothetical protein
MMKKRKTLEHLRACASKADPQKPSDCIEAVLKLAPFHVHLKTSSLEAAKPFLAQDAPELFEKPSLQNDRDFVVLIVISDEIPNFEKALALPLYWGKDQEDDPLLPKELLELAEGVRKKYGFSGKFGLRRSTVLGEKGEGWDLSQMALEPNSAGAVLASCLELASKSYGCQSNITATACLRINTDGGVLGVAQETLEAKLLAAKRVGITDLYLAPYDYYWLTQSQFYQVNKEQFPNVERLGDSRDWSKALAPLSLALAFPLDPETASLEERLESHNQLLKWGDQKKAEDFYWDFLLDLLAENCAKKHAAELQSLQGGTLVTLLSFTPAITWFMIQALQPKKVVLFQTKETKDSNPRVIKFLDRLKEIEQKIEQKKVTVPTGDEDCFMEFVEAKDSFSPELFQPGPVVFDLTPGTKSLVFVLFEKIKDYCDAVLSLATKGRSDSKGPEAGTERILRLKTLP